MLSTSIADVALWSCGHKIACQFRNPMVHARSKECCQAKEGALWSLVGSVDSWGNWWYRQAKYAAARLSTIKNSGVGEFLVVHGGGLSVDVLGGRSSAPPTLYSESGKLLTSTGNLLNPTDTASVEDAEAKDSEFELIYHSGWSHWGCSEALQWQWRRSILSNPSLWTLWSCLSWQVYVIQPFKCCYR